jgi:RHS repeat-associated protein
VRPDGGETRLAWDGANRLREAITEGGDLVTFRYDALGRRVAKVVGDRVVRFFWDGDRLLADEAAPGHAREFVHRPGTWEVMATANGRVCHFDNDQVGLPHAVVDADGGAVVWAAEYDANGAATRVGGEGYDNPARFQGQYHDTETGLSYNRFRYYDPEAGAFVSADPLGLAPGPDPYRYAPNPWIWVDPFGLACANYTAQSRRHVYTHGHAANSPPVVNAHGAVVPKSRFKPREGGQKFTDEVMNHPNVTVTHQANGRVVYDVPDLANPPATPQRITGYDQAGNPVHGGRVVVEGPTPASWSTYSTDEVVTQFPR